MAIETQLSDIDGGSIQLESSLFALVKHGLDKNPHSPAAIVTHQSEDHLKALTLVNESEDFRKEDCLSWSYTDIHNASLKLVTGFSKYGVNSGATITTFIPNGIEPLLLYWTSMLGKFTFAPLDPGATDTIRSSEARTLLETITPEVVVVPDATAAANIDTVLDSLTNKPIVKIILDSTAILPSGWIDLLTVASETVDLEIAHRITTDAMTDDLERIAVIMFTSGTSTGKPKGCPLTVANRLHFAAGMDMRTGDDGQSRCAYITQNYRAIALAIGMCFWFRGHCLVLPGPGFSPQLLLEAVERHKITWTAFVPFALHAVVAHPNFQNTNISSIRSIAVGADMVTDDMYRKTVKAFPEAECWAAFGMTEGGAAFDWSLPIDAIEEDIPWHAGIAPLGKVAKGARVKVADDNNMALPRKSVGELHISCGAFLRRYSQDVKPEDFYVEGSTYWFKTGDTGLMNSDGWVYILGRKKDIIKRAGVPVTPGALESALDAFLQSQTSVVGMPHETLGHEPFAVVRSLNGHSKEQVKKHVVDIFGYDYALGGVVTLEDLGLSDFPINQSEKIMKLDLQRAVAQYV